MGFDSREGPRYDIKPVVNILRIFNVFDINVQGVKIRTILVQCGLPFPMGLTLYLGCNVVLPTPLLFPPSLE